METKKDPGRTLTIIGYIALAIALLISFIPNKVPALGGGGFFDDGGNFFVIYAIAFIYSCAILIHSFILRKWRFLKMDRRHFISALILFSISAFSLNDSIPLFSAFPIWVKIYLTLMHIGLLAIPYVHRIPKPFRALNFLLLGLGTVMSFYFSIYLMRYAHIGIMGAFFFGITLHLFSPLFFLITCITQFVKLKNQVIDVVSYTAGLALPILFVGMVLISWKQNEKLIHEASAALITRPDNTLPKWIIYSQRLPQNWFIDKAIRGNLSYDLPEWGRDFWGAPSTSFSEHKAHDPLVYLCFLFHDELDLTREERINILQSQFDACHQAQRKLWSGKHLSTAEILTNIQVFPEYRLAYLEKILHIKNNGSRSWPREEEAAYTFHLPEGSVATSLSLWIDGVEEKSRLTTKQKADSAYVAIVGRERRDPALMHWQEGNTITVTVFPCTTEETRQFKIGLTIPLEKRDDSLVLKNVYFEGPKLTGSYETTVVRFTSDQPPAEVNLPSGFDEVSSNTYQYTGNYRPYWEISCALPPLSNEAFSFNGKSFRLSELSGNNQAFDPEYIYLDINKSWTEAEFNAVWAVVKDKEVYAYRDQLEPLTEINKDKFFQWMSADNFSLFPVDVIANPSKSLIISKSAPTSPSLSDLKETAFSERLQVYLASVGSRISLFSLNAELSPYLKTLKEFQAFNYATGDVEMLATLMKHQRFPKPSSSDSNVELSISNTIITQDTLATPASNAPDHLMRLFAYNQILKKTGQHYFEPTPHLTDELIDIASEAYVVSPISSLIVLETVKDYKRFGIEENENSLNNAKVTSSGAVPEPHEWALIILTALLFGWLYIKGQLRI